VGSVELSWVRCPSTTLSEAIIRDRLGQQYAGDVSREMKRKTCGLTLLIS
jgi:hypothetical protein